MVLILAGNTWFPILLRLCCKMGRWISSEPNDGFARSGPWNLLLSADCRRCYTHLFPGFATRWLVIASISLIALQVIVLMLTEFTLTGEDQIMAGLSTPERLLSIVFHAVSTRTAGFAVLNLSLLSAPSAYVFIVCMFISTVPAVVAMRYTEQGELVATDSLDN